MYCTNPSVPFVLLNIGICVLSEYLFEKTKLESHAFPLKRVSLYFQHFEIYVGDSVST